MTQFEYDRARVQGSEPGAMNQQDVQEEEAREGPSASRSVITQDLGPSSRFLENLSCNDNFASTFQEGPNTRILC